MKGVLTPALVGSNKIVNKLPLIKSKGVYPHPGIRFISPDAVNQYGRDVVIEPLNKDVVYETLVILRDDRLLAHLDGDMCSVVIPTGVLEQLGANLELIHGHPSGLPLSVTDYAALMKNENIQSIVAYNAVGEYSKFTKLPPKEFKHFAKYRSTRLLEKQINTAQSNMGMHIYRLLAKINKNENALKKTESEQIVAELEQQYRELASKMNLVWQECSKRLGIMYEHSYKK